MKVRLMTLVGAATVLAASLTGASAQSAQFLNLTGQFQCVRLCLAGPPALAYLTQADWQLNLVNEAGVPSRGWIDYPGHIWVVAWNEGAFYSPDGMTIEFNNGTVWQRVIEVAPLRHHYRFIARLRPTADRRLSPAVTLPIFRRAQKDPDCAWRHNPDFCFCGNAAARRPRAQRSLDCRRPPSPRRRPSTAKTARPPKRS